MGKIPLTFAEIESVAFSFIRSLPHITDFIQNKITCEELGNILNQTTADTIKYLAQDGNGIWLLWLLESDIPENNVNKRQLLQRFTQLHLIYNNQQTAEEITRLEKLTESIFSYYEEINEPFLTGIIAPLY